MLSLDSMYRHLCFLFAAIGILVVGSFAVGLIAGAERGFLMAIGGAVLLFLYWTVVGVIAFWPTRS